MTDPQACQVLLDRLSSGVSVKTSDIYKVVDDTHADQLRQELKSLREQRGWFNSAKAELREYTKLLNNADLLYNRADKLAATAHRRRVARLSAGKAFKASKHDELYEKAESLYEDALEHLAEITEDRADLLALLYPQLDLYKSTGQETVSADKDSMPRLHFPFPDADAIKRSTLRDAIENADVLPTSDHDNQRTQDILKAKLKRLRG